MDNPRNHHERERRNIQVNGIISSANRNNSGYLLRGLYNEVKSFMNCCCFRLDCPSYDMRTTSRRRDLCREGISGLDFDSKGIHLAAGTQSGCLTILEFDNLYCSVYGQNSGLYDEQNCLLHICTDIASDVVKWNPENENEVCCVSYDEDKVLLYDINRGSHEPTRMFEKGVGWNSGASGLTDIAFSLAHTSRLHASGYDGAVHMWDMRLGNAPSLKLTSAPKISGRVKYLNSIETGAEDWMVFGANNFGKVFSFDLRGGRQSSPEVDYYHCFDVAKMVMELQPLLDDINFSTDFNQVYSIRRDPSFPRQLAFHIRTGGSGVLDLHTETITQLHCPNAAADRKYCYMRRPAWMPGISTSRSSST